MAHIVNSIVLSQYIHFHTILTFNVLCDVSGIKSLDLSNKTIKNCTILWIFICAPSQWQMKMLLLSLGVQLRPVYMCVCVWNNLPGPILHPSNSSHSSQSILYTLLVHSTESEKGKGIKEQHPQKIIDHTMCSIILHVTVNQCTYICPHAHTCVHIHKQINTFLHAYVWQICTCMYMYMYHRLPCYTNTQFVLGLPG